MLSITTSRAMAGTVLLGLLTVSACSTDADSPSGTISSSPTPSSDPDVESLEQLAEDLWAAREEASRNSDPDRARFEGILAPQLLEREVAELEQYQSLGVTREGSPRVTAIEATAEGDTGTVTMCLDEDDWQAFEEDRLIEGDDLGPVPYGFTAERVDDTWQVIAVIESADIDRTTPC